MSRNLLDSRLSLPVRIGMGVLLFFFLYSINFTFLPTFTSRLIAVGVILYWGWYWRSRGELEFRADGPMRQVAGLWLALFLWVLYRTLATGGQDPNWLANTTLLLLQVSTGAAFITAWFYSHGYSFRALVRLLQICIVIQSLFIIFYFFSWEFKYFSLTIIPEGGNVPALHPYRSRGLTHQASASLAAFQATGLLFTAYLIVKARSWKEMLPDLMAVGVLTASIFLTGRSGFLVIPFLFLFVGLHISMTGRVGKRISTWVASVPLILLGGFLAMEFIYVQLGGWAAPWGGGDAFRSMTEWTFVEYEDLVTEGRSRTTDVLLRDHWFFPQTTELWLLGDPRTYDLNRVDSDIGIVRRIFGLGLIGSILTWLLIAVIFFYTLQACRDRAEWLLILLYGGWILMLEFKEPFLTDFRFAGLFLLFFFYQHVMPLQEIHRVRIEDGGNKSGKALPETPES